MKREELLKGLTQEQIEKVNACNSQEELLKLAKDEDIELTDEQLDAVSGGCGKDKKDEENNDNNDEGNNNNENKGHPITNPF